MISQTAEYALRAVVCLAADPARPMTTQEIADRTQVPVGYLSKVLQMLGRAGIVDSRRGLHGGFTMMRDPKSLTVLEVVNAVDPIVRVRACPLGLSTHSEQLCPLHQRIDDAIAAIETAFDDSVIADLAVRADGAPPLCATPAAGSRNGGIA